MISIRKHFQGKATHIIGDCITNGCQTFHIRDLDEVCEEFRVSAAQKQAVIDAHAKNKSVVEQYHLPYNNDYKILLSHIINGANIDKIKEIAYQQFEDLEATFLMVSLIKYGYFHDEYKGIDSAHIKIALAKAGKFQDELHKSEHWRIREAVALAGGYLEVLHTDDDQDVRQAVAYSDKEGKYADYLYQRDRDSDPGVLINIARNGHLLDKLFDDNNSDVRLAVAEADKDGVYAQYFHDNTPYWNMRLALARNGFFVEEYKTDNDDDVREAALEYLKEHGAGRTPVGRKEA